MCRVHYRVFAVFCVCERMCICLFSSFFVLFGYKMNYWCHVDLMCHNVQCTTWIYKLIHREVIIPLIVNSNVCEYLFIYLSVCLYEGIINHRILCKWNPSEFLFFFNQSFNFDRFFEHISDWMTTETSNIVEIWNKSNDWLASYSILKR